MIPGLPAATVWLAIGSSFLAAARDGPGASPSWLGDYGEAMCRARRTSSMLLVWFDSGSGGLEWLESWDFDHRGPGGHVPVRLAPGYAAPIAGVTTLLAAHAAFSELGGGPGLAIIDLAEPDRATYGHVVSVYPFGDGLISRDEFQTLLELPEGTLTERTLIFAVRTHPDHPRSAGGERYDVLVAEATSHAAYQARIRRQGHHDWESRFHRINATIPADCVAQEVCAESWPGQRLLAAARECVRSWRGSPGHWDAVERGHAGYGYDMQRGRNGIWYATGIFARKRE